VLESRVGMRARRLGELAVWRGGRNNQKQHDVDWRAVGGRWWRHVGVRQG